VPFIYSSDELYSFAMQKQMIPAPSHTLDARLWNVKIQRLFSAALRKKILTVILPRRLQGIRCLWWSFERISSGEKNILG